MREKIKNFVKSGWFTFLIAIIEYLVTWTWIYLLTNSIHTAFGACILISTIIPFLVGMPVDLLRQYIK